MKQFTQSTIKCSLLLLVALLLSVFVTGCRKTKDQTIKIGVVGPLTGEGATYGESMRRGFDLAFQDEPDIRLIYEDSKLSPKEGVSAINKLIFSDKVQVVLGAAASGVTMAMVPVAEKNKVILFSSISTSDNLRTSGEYFFRNVPRNEIQGKLAAHFLSETLGKETAVVFKKNDEYGNDLSKGFINEYEKMGGKILLNEAYQPKSTDFRSFITKAKALNPEAVYIPGNYQEVAIFLKQAYEASLKAVFVGGDGSYSPELIRIAGNAAEGSYYTMMTLTKNKYYTEFLKKFKTKYKKEPDVYDAYAYEAADIILNAIKSAGNDASGIRNYLLSNTFDMSLTGPLKFDKDGEVQRECVIYEVKDSEFVQVK